MSIGSTQLANMLNSLERAIKEDSLSQIEYQSLIDTLNNGIVVQTDWWIFGVSLASVMSFIVLTVMIWWTNKKQGEQQIKVQKDNIKLQLFDKRYAVFQSVVDARNILNRDDHFLIGVYNNNYFIEIGKQFVDVYNQLTNSMLVSQSLFDEKIYEKMSKLSSLFMDTRKEFYNLNLAGATKTPQIPEDKENQLRQIIMLYANDVDTMAVELNKIMPELGNVLKPWQEAVLAFNNYIDTSGITTDFDKYIMVQRLDK